MPLRSNSYAGGRHKRLLFAGSRLGKVPKRPETVRDLVEGGSLDYLVTMGEVTMFFGVTANFQERRLGGVRPTVLFMQAGGGRGTHYEERLLAAAGYPPYVVPTHWDDYEEPLTESAVDWLGAHRLGERVAEVSPDSEFVLLDRLESFTFEG